MAPWKKKSLAVDSTQHYKELTHDSAAPKILVRQKFAPLGLKKRKETLASRQLGHSNANVTSVV